MIADDTHAEPLPDCERCGHAAEWHRSARLLYPAAFQCVGPGLDGCNAECPDYVQTEL